VDGQNRTALGLYGGYQWTSNIGVELGYMDLGEVRTRLTGTAVDIDDYLNSANKVHPRSADGYTLALNARYAFNDHAYMFARGGVFYIRSNYQSTGQDEQALRFDKDRQGFWGLGFSHEIAESWEIRVSWERFTVEEENIPVWGLGVKHQFVR
jgi:opacity protein-like surface antigen